MLLADDQHFETSACGLTYLAHQAELLSVQAGPTSIKIVPLLHLGMLPCRSSASSVFRLCRGLRAKKREAARKQQGTSQRWAVLFVSSSRGAQLKCHRNTCQEHVAHHILAIDGALQCCGYCGFDCKPALVSPKNCGRARSLTQPDQAGMESLASGCLASGNAASHISYV
jgi:hypothetical protein